MSNMLIVKEYSKLQRLGIIYTGVGDLELVLSALSGINSGHLPSEVTKLVAENNYTARLRYRQVLSLLHSKTISCLVRDTGVYSVSC